MTTKPEYPEWVCRDCGAQYGNRPGGLCTMHYGKCDVCGESKAVTQPRDFGGLRDGWEDHNKGAA